MASNNTLMMVQCNIVKDAKNNDGISHSLLQTTKKLSHFNRKFLSTKLSNFLYHGANCMLVIYLVSFFTSTGMTPSQAGIIVGSRYISQVAGSAILGWLMDQTNHYMLITSISMIISTMSVTGFVFLPYIIYGVSETAFLSSNVTINVIKNITNDTETLNVLINNNTQNTMLSVYPTEAFFLSFFFCNICSFFEGNQLGSLEAFTILISLKLGKNNSYAWQRMWSMIGYGTFSLLIGIVIRYVQVTFISQFIVAYFMYFVIKVILFLPFAHLARYYGKSLKQNIAVESCNYLLKMTMKKPIVMLCMLLQFLMGFVGNVIFTYLAIYMDKNMKNGSMLVLGLTTFLQCLFGALFSPYVEIINRKLKNTYFMIALAFLGYGLGCMLIFFVNDAYYVIGISFIYGISRPVYIITMNLELQKITHQKCLVSFLNIASAMQNGIGGGIGSVVGGYVYQYYADQLYIIMAIVCLLTAAGLFCKCLFEKIRETRDNKLLVIQNNLLNL
ncbi:uncharacterized protein LOC101239257 isoform X1 [Hydra vulgaris]|uniref:Uncharacterized protein LOC101239257 isoform X1 n=2 Tax=Hydra vulgaris TaxID=6087 RepID=A0ABM4DAA7_HYDVU